jgi:hypothetical protein
MTMLSLHRKLGLAAFLALVMLTAATMAGAAASSGGDRPSESISLDFTQIEWNFGDGP